MENMVNYSFSEFYHTSFRIENHGCHLQFWEFDKGWAEFCDKSRFASGLVAITEDITARYTNFDGDVLIVNRGDIIYVPYGGKYNFEVIDIPKAVLDKGSIYKTITIHFNMFDENENIIALSDRPIVLVNSNYNFISEFVSINKNVGCPMFTMSKLYSMLYNLTNVQLNHSSNYSLIKKGINYLQQNYNKEVSIAKCAEICGLSESYFRKVFKEQIDMTPIDYRNQLRITRARELLTDKSLNISEIANIVGIKDQFYFSRLFKSVAGVSPIEFRKS